jgi:hypothetical protein
MTIKIVQTVVEVLETGKYPAKIASIEEADGQFGAQLKFSFELPNPKGGENKILVGWTSQKFTPSSKLYLWTEAAFGAITRDYEFNSDDLLGKKVTLVVTEETREKGTYNKITTPYPISPHLQFRNLHQRGKQNHNMGGD